MKTQNNITINGNMSAEEIVFEILQATETNWSVQKENLVSITGKSTGSFGMFRSDNGNWLGTMKDRYTPFQNHELVSTLYHASAGIGNQYRGGNLQDGRKVFYQIGLPDYAIGNDTLKRFVTAINSHDGTTSIAFGSTNVVVVCQNTFYRAYGEIDKFRHMAGAAERIKLAAEELRRTIALDGNLMESFERMTDHKIEKGLFESIVGKLFSVDLNAKQEDVGTRKANTIKQFNQVLESELQSHGNNVWGLFNAVTYFENHIRTKEETKQDSIYVGGAAKRMNATYDEIMAWIEEHTATLVPVNM